MRSIHTAHIFATKKQKEKLFFVKKGMKLRDNPKKT